MTFSDDMGAGSSSFLKKSQKIFLIGSILVSLGILLVTVGGSWDITNHLLNRPETFFSLPHALLYSGVGITIAGTATSLFGWRNLSELKNTYTSSLKIKFIGITMLIGAGPFDFIWHSNFGLDGLLSPPHITLITGMLFCSIGGMIGITGFLKQNLPKHSSQTYLLVLAILPFWLSGSGMIASLSLPFSNTDYFRFNPEPTTAFFVATIAYPFLISFSALLVSRLSNFQFGIISVLGGIFLLIYGATAIIPNFALLDSVGFYALNLIPFIVADTMIYFGKSQKSMFFVGGMLGSIFYMIYYPYVTYTYNEILLGKIISPSIIYEAYFQLMIKVLEITILPAIVMGICATYLSNKIHNKLYKKICS